MFSQGQRVKAWGEKSKAWLPGEVNYVRFAPPTYTLIEAVSVRLDMHAGRLGYEGSIFSADKVKDADDPATLVPFAG